MNEIRYIWTLATTLWSLINKDINTIIYCFIIDSFGVFDLLSIVFSYFLSKSPNGPDIRANVVDLSYFIHI